MKSFLGITLVFLSLFQGYQCLRCFTCENNVHGDLCITDPESVGVSTICQSPNDEYCYTSRVEEEGGEVIFYRGCCRVVDKSPVCPPGGSFQEIPNENPPYTKYLTRCSGDFCNDSEGNVEPVDPNALQCYTCDNNAHGDLCITDPVSVGVFSTCQSPNDDFCYTSRVEEEGGGEQNKKIPTAKTVSNSAFVAITLNRGCCRVIENSPVCPPGDDYQEHPNEIPPFTKYLTRCIGDLCNVSEGNGENDG